MEIVTKVMEKSWKSHGILLVKMCTNPVYIKCVFKMHVVLMNIYINFLFVLKYIAFK